MEKANTILESKNISKSYGSIDALKDVNLNFSENKIYGLFGRNGAGKNNSIKHSLIKDLCRSRGNLSPVLEKTFLHIPISLQDNCCYMPEKHYFPPKS